MTAGAHGAPWIRVAKFVVSVGAFVWLASTLDGAAVEAALLRIPAPNLLAALAGVVFAMVVGAYRHVALMDAYGARSLPTLRRALFLYWVGFFYNTFLPGSVSGDVLRAVTAREAFGERGTLASFAVVLVERLLGLAGLVIVAGVAYAWTPLSGVSGLTALVLVGVALAFAGVSIVAMGRRLAPLAPGPVGAFLERLPSLVRVAPFVSAFAASVVSQLTVAGIGHALASGLDADLPFGASAVVVPLGAAAAYFPLSISGLGVREAAFSRLYQLAGLDVDAAVAFAVAFLGIQLVGASVGGVLAFVDARTGGFDLH